jgi:hypothetical protein
MLRAFDFNDDYLGQFDWTVEMFEALMLDSGFREHFTLFTIRVLLSKGFILGKDFSMTCERKILTSQSIQENLSASIPIPEQILLRQILQVF